MADSATRVLITGGAGFIGSHLSDFLEAHGYNVGRLDSLVPQVHPSGDWPSWSPIVNSWTCDVRDGAKVLDVLRQFRPQVVVHLAAEVGVGQAEYEIERYVDANVHGTAVLLESILKANDDVPDAFDGVARFVVAGSMSSYGEGLYLCPKHGPVRPSRTGADLASGKWTPTCNATAEACDEVLEIAQTPEWCSLRPSGIYALTKRDQEELSLLLSRSRGLSTAVTRFFNVYGPRQQPGNPYTGVTAIFGSAARRGVSPTVYEDGGQVRDFVHVSDVVAALAILVGDPNSKLSRRTWANPAYQGVFNVGTGRATTIKQVADLACEVLAPPSAPNVTGQFRTGDVRACIANPTRMTELGWAPQVDTKQGLTDLFAVYRELEIPTPPDAHAELGIRGLLYETKPDEDVAEGADSASAWVQPEQVGS